MSARQFYPVPYLPRSRAVMACHPVYSNRACYLGSPPSLEFLFYALKVVGLFARHQQSQSTIDKLSLLAVCQPSPTVSLPPRSVPSVFDLFSYSCTKPTGVCFVVLWNECAEFAVPLCMRYARPSLQPCRVARASEPHFGVCPLFWL